MDAVRRMDSIASVKHWREGMEALNAIDTPNEDAYHPYNEDPILFDGAPEFDEDTNYSSLFPEDSDEPAQSEQEPAATLAEAERPSDDTRLPEVNQIQGESSKPSLEQT